ncbi:MAG: sigma-70 family RNA polymerase sigma factor [Victivallaceae bacterium]|nr:sigma-70 family RNA polymerase sigma factor [Victivallaceae bacterium]
MALKYPTTSRTLLDKISSGDEITWNEFFSRYNPVVLAVARFKGLSADEADDVAQQVMLTFFQQSKTFHFDPDVARFRTYFGRIVRAKIADCYRKRDLVPTSDDELEKAADHNLSDAGLDAAFLAEFRKSVMDDVYHLLKQQVSAATWQAFELYALQNRPVEKVAAYLGCSINRVYQAKKRCLGILRGIVGEWNRRDPQLKLGMLGDE